MNSNLIFSNGVSMELHEDEGRFLGIGAIRHNGIELRSNLLPWTLYTESEVEGCGLRFQTFLLDEVTEANDEVILTLRSKGNWMPRLGTADAMGEARVAARRLYEPEAQIRWRFRAITERLYEKDWQGLSMDIEYSCPDAPIHWIMEAATWEIGGDAAGCTLIQQDVSTIQLEEHVEVGSAFSTVEKFFTSQWGGSFPMDMMPRAAGASICDFQAKGGTVLCLFSERPGLTRARLEKFSNENVIHYMDRCYFPMGATVRTPERKLLVHQAPSALQKHEVRNLWLDCFTEVRRRIHKTYDFELEIPEPSTGGHLWDDDLKKHMACWADPMKRDFPEYAQLGYRQLYFHGVWDSITSDPAPPAAGNICCPYAFRFAESFGGASGMKAVNDAARTHGLRLMQWFCFHLSRYAPVWKEHPDWVLRQADGDPWDGSYHGLWSGRMRSAYADHFKTQVEKVKEETGIDGIFWDSYHNLGVLAVDWGSPDKAPQAEEIFRMQSDLQRKGFRQLVEVTTIFGVSRVAMFGFKGNAFRRRLWDDFVQGDHAFALIDTTPSFFLGDETDLLGPERLNPERYFWLAAHRILPGIPSDPWELRRDRLPGGENAEAYARTNHLYNGHVSRMHRLRLQEGGTHVLWLDAANRPSVLWAFQDNIPTPEGEWLDAETGLEAGPELEKFRVFVRRSE